VYPTEKKTPLKQIPMQLLTYNDFKQKEVVAKTMIKKMPCHITPEQISLKRKMTNFKN
jgi:hypothetical protein